MQENLPYWNEIYLFVIAGIKAWTFKDVLAFFSFPSISAYDSLSSFVMFQGKEILLTE